ncbi:hypothetical protein EZM97_22310 [Dyella soli]|uniref:Uncharacterized protein n=1 Tax=Dyella soli TaxID=522319 RepID=A0A4R0YUY4_9GAMM|nr:hypothetical protein [Dyella soli]TCI08976.1 hypothetical protein EZM97_22310 [Dyella soli]
MRQLAAVVLALCITMGVCAQALTWRYPGDRITFDQWTAYFDELAHRKGAIVTEQSQYYIINLFSDREQPALYVFTKPNHPAYPAVVIRAVETRDGESHIVRHGHYAGDQAQFDRWWHAFDALDKQNIEDAR